MDKPKPLPNGLSDFHCVAFLGDSGERLCLVSSMQAHQEVQAIAKGVMAELASTITFGATESSIAQRATQMMANRGAHGTCYRNCPALVLLGSRSEQPHAQQAGKCCGL